MAATAPATVWEKNYGSDGIEDTGASVWQTSDDGFIITGRTELTGQSTGSRAMLVKTDWQGNEIWKKYYDDGAEGRFVRQTSDGGYIVVGQAGGNPFVLKTDANGDKVWDKVYPRPSGRSGEFNCIWPTTDGGYFMSGDVYYNDAKTQWDMYAAKIDGTGNLQWEKFFADANGPGELCFGSWPTSDGGLILGGSMSPLKNPTTGAVTYPAALVKTDANGNQQWFKILKDLPGRRDSDYGGIQQTRDGGYIWASVSGGKMNIIKTDANGNPQWNTTFDDYGVCYSVQQTWDDGYIVTGGPTGVADVIVIRTDASGKLLWEKKLKGAGVGKGISIQQIGNGSYVVAGITKTTDKNAQADFYLAELDKDMTPVPNAKVTSENIPAQFEANQSFSVSVTFQNNGTKPWTFQDETMFSPVGGSTGDAVLFGVTKTQTIPIGTVIRPGQSMTFEYVLTAPAMNGTYYPEVRMLWEGHDFFGQPAVKAVKVVNGTADTRKPTATATAIATGTVNPTAQATSTPTGAPTTESGSGIPCLSVVLPLLLVGTVTVGMYRRRNKQE